ncbi:hypothetical protein PSAC2689_10374 [Paraburkholderia sacchari]
MNIYGHALCSKGIRRQSFFALACVRLYESAPTILKNTRRLAARFVAHPSDANSRWLSIPRHGAVRRGDSIGGEINILEATLNQLLKSYRHTFLTNPKCVQGALCSGSTVSKRFIA